MMPDNIQNTHHMKQPSSTEAHIADLNRTTVHPDVAIHTHLCFMNMMRDWQEEHEYDCGELGDYSRLQLMDIMEGLMDMYEDKL